MSAQITVTQDDDFVMIKVVGRPTLQEMLDVGIGLDEGDKFVVGGRLWDFRESQVDFTAAEVKEMASVSQRMVQHPSKVAILVSNDLTFGLSRMYQVFRESEHMAVSVFRDESEALRWLLAD